MKIEERRERERKRMGCDLKVAQVEETFGSANVERKCTPAE